MGFASNAAQPLPVAESLLKAGQNDADWLLPAKTYSGNRYTALLNRKTGKVVHRLALNDQTGLDTQPVVVGEAGNQQTPNLPKAQGSRVITYRLDAVPTIVNDASGQVALANATNGGGESAASLPKSTGSAPYTAQPFPTMDLPALQQVTLGATTCAPGGEEHARASTIAGSQ
jgi:hypothetical protein